MKYATIAFLVLVTVVFGYQAAISMDQKEKPMTEFTGKTASAVFAGGCFWCTESDFEKVEGVLEVISGYTGGRLPDPTYEQVSAGGTGHIEAVKIVYDPARIDYKKLLAVFWRHVDPTDAGGQFVDRGAQYRSAIFYANADEKRMAEGSKKRLAATGVFDKPIVTDILPLGEFYVAEDYHQDYYQKNPLRYRWYRSGSGRDRFLELTWANGPDLMKLLAPKDAAAAENHQAKMDSQPVYTIPSEEELRQRLSPMQFKVTRKDGTEPPFRNEYFDNHDAGIYVDIVSGEPLFSSTDKFDSGTGWPSFTKPLVEENVVEKTDRSFFMVRTEVRSRHADSHLGHVFEDGPAPTGLRYCINSASLRFIPADKLEQEGYGRFASLFK